jgi:hypothetical protein
MAIEHGKLPCDRTNSSNKSSAMTIRAHCYQIAENSVKELESHRHGKLVAGEIFRFLFSQLAIKIV